MDVNADFSERVMLHSDEIDWKSSPMAGVDRRRLDRIDNEADRVTTIVRYAPGSHFSPHIHTGGEEFLVLEGIFEDDYGHWPTGSYIRNPPTSKHQPGSKNGCVIFVKLAQFNPDDRTFVHADIAKLGSVEDRHRDGVKVSPLFKDADEEVRIEYWDANTSINIDTENGAEILVLDGGFKEGGDELRKHSWLRLPSNYVMTAIAGKKGAQVWIKTGHLKGL